MEKNFTKTIEVFEKVAANAPKKEMDGGMPNVTRIEYTISEKQFNWLWNTYQNIDKGEFGTTVTVKSGAPYPQYHFGVRYESLNAPKYIPNRAQYGKKYTIIKHIKES